MTTDNANLIYTSMTDQSLYVDKSLCPAAFYYEYVHKGKPVVIKGATREWEAFEKWDMNYFWERGGNTILRVKEGNVSQGQFRNVLMRDYVQQLMDYESSKTKGVQTPLPPYLHDVAIFNLMPNLINDVMPFKSQYLPGLYHREWWKYVQFFMSLSGHITPLHFDTLVTHNLFFQVKGKKKFILIAREDKKNCYIKGWRWAGVNPSRPDYEQFPNFKNVKPVTVEVDAGDILYMPPGMLHYVESLSFSISFNIDWHTPKSVLGGAFSVFEGAPRENFKYNMLLLLALWLKLPDRYFFSYYKSYLNYIS